MFDDEIWRYLPLGPLPTVVIGVVGLLLLVDVTLRATPRRKRLAVVLLAATVVAVGLITLGGGGTGGRSVNFTPGAGVRVQVQNLNPGLGVANLAGNILMFVPVGWLFSALTLYSRSISAARGLVRGVAAGVVLSFAVEVSQYFLGRAADIDDVLLNAAGGLIGAVVGSTLSAARRRRAGSEDGRLPIATGHLR